MLIIETKYNGTRLDKYLSENISDVSRTRLKSLIESGHVTVDGSTLTDPAAKVREGQKVILHIPPVEEAIPQPQAIPLEILYEDADIIVINKPAGLVVHPAPGNPEGTLVNALLNHCGASLSGINGVKRPGIVHRLDKETSGLIVAAKNDKAHQSLTQQLASRTMKRVYQALVWGRPLPVQGTIEGAIGRDTHHRQRMALQSRGKFARTHYKSLESFGTIASLIECRLETGRTHQIRVHLTSKGHGLMGDSTYGKSPKGVPLPLKTYLKEKWKPHRQALHAKEIALTHPTTHEEMHFSVDLPEDMRKLIDVLHSLK